MTGWFGARGGIQGRRELRVGFGDPIDGYVFALAGMAEGVYRYLGFLKFL